MTVELGVKQAPLSLWHLDENDEPKIKKVVDEPGWYIVAHIGTFDMDAVARGPYETEDDARHEVEHVWDDFAEWEENAKPEKFEKFEPKPLF
jgi:hypothetical protein